jgi:putative Mg2+ transporter-C (MgtC) family protein
MDLSYLDIGLRLGAAALAGGTIGINRDLADRPIGTRTLGLVALGAAAVAVATVQVAGMAENPDAMSRVVQGIIQALWAASALSARA